MQGGAEFSDCGSYRYLLWREWDRAHPTVAFLMLNPSTADHRVTDPTIARCLAWAVKEAFGRLEVVNLYPLRATNPNKLLQHPDPLGERALADAAIVKAIERASTVICAWGSHRAARERAIEVMRLLSAAGAQHKLFHLGLNHDGSPKHPLYLAASVRPGHFELRACGEGS
ncbi:DUF1643 domain-containing protein [Trinickia fusca]|uniref:DUF1643 domain-containing protein n=2 Tax=Trinickia fusca TaxID=2419777 RepID=A0A494XCW8_9BURK|nr:DUF1643 domain-containing protein [Trinickia fusca]